MNNEERIIEMLTAMQADISGLKSDVTSLKAGQAKLEAGQARLETRVEDIHNNLAVLENDYQQTRGALFDKLDVLETKTDAIAADVTVIKDRVDTDELYIRVFDKKLRQA